jgi:hypothetical protein
MMYLNQLKKKMKINQIWDELGNDSSLAKGLLLRRYSGTVLPDVFVAIQHPEKILGIAGAISETIKIDISQFDNLQDIQIELTPDLKQKGKNLLVFKLVNSLHRDIFSSLCEDLITSISSETNEQQLVRILLNRFEKWKSLFTQVVSEGLSPEAQRGLFGELYFLRKFLKGNHNYTSIINTWQGTSKEIRDFQMHNWALEVKTTHGNNHQRIHISNERQLDASNIENLFLYHISLEKVQNSGESLNDIVYSISNLLISDIVALNRFKAKLYEGGYFDHHKQVYDSVGYFIRGDVFYGVKDEFPRIQEKELRSGIGDVKYTIIASQCEAYIQTEEMIFQNLVI